MATNHYRPSAGEQIFVSLYGNEPFLVTVTGYHHDNRFSSEQFDYIRKDGRPISSSLNEAVFYPYASVDTKFLYLVVMEESEFMDKSEHYTLCYFFDPQSAFDYIEAIEAGQISPRIKPTGEFVEYSVQVEKV